jgi:polyhydroxybutyrate depolymerase
MPDVVFVSQLIDAIEASYNVDRTRVYADGLSNGGGMAFALSCTLPDRIAAVGMVSAAQSLDWSWCGEHRPVASIAFHGTADPVVPYGGGPTPVGPDVFPSVPAFTAEWARRNRCGPEPNKSTAAPDVTRIEYTACADNADVVLYTVEGGGHQWPGGRRLPEFLVGPYTGAIDATRVIWAFFREHRRAPGVRRLEAAAHGRVGGGDDRGRGELPPVDPGPPPAGLGLRVPGEGPPPGHDGALLAGPPPRSTGSSRPPGS